MYCFPEKWFMHIRIWKKTITDFVGNEAFNSKGLWSSHCFFLNLLLSTCINDNHMINAQTSSSFSQNTTSNTGTGVATKWRISFSVWSSWFSSLRGREQVFSKIFTAHQTTLTSQILVWVFYACRILNHFEAIHGNRVVNLCMISKWTTCFGLQAVETFQ